MAAPTTTHSVTVRKLSSTISSLWTKIKSTFQTLGNLVTSFSDAPSDTKYPSEKLVKVSLDGKVSVSDVKNASWGVNILRQSFLAKNGTTVDNTNKTITATYDTSKSTDIYCYALTNVPIVLGETYTISFDVIESNLTEGQHWDWGFFGQGHAVFRITGTGHYSKTLVSDINRSVGYGALIDDGDKSLSNGSYIVMKNIKYEIGPFETKYTDLDPLLVTGYNALSTTLGPMIRALSSWSNPAEGEFIPAASGSSQGRYTLRKIFDFFKSLMASDSGVNISGNAATATAAAGYTSGGAIDTALQEKATPADITSAIQALDVASQGGDGKYIKAISEADGKISATEETMDTTPTASSTKAVTSGGVKTALDGKQARLGISPSGDPQKFLNEQGDFVNPATGTVSGVKGAAESTYRTGQVSLSPTDIGAWGDYGYFSNGAATAARWGKVAKVHWNSAFDGYCAVRGVFEMHQYGGNVVTTQFVITFNTSYAIGYAHMYGIFSDSNLTSQVKLGARFNQSEDDLLLYGYIYNHAYSGVSVSIMDVKHYKGNKPNCTITHYSDATSQSNEPVGITYCTNHGW